MESVAVHDIVLAAAHRCTHVTGVLDMVRASGCWIATSSQYELEAAVAAGVDVSEVLHAPAAMSVTEFDRLSALQLGVLVVPSLASLPQRPASVDAANSDDATRLGLTIAVDDVAGALDRLQEFDGATRARITHLHVRASQQRRLVTELGDVAERVAAVWKGAVEWLELSSLSVEMDVIPPSVALVGGVDARLNQAFGRPVSGAEENGPPLAELLRDFIRGIGEAGVCTDDVIVDPGSIVTGGQQFTLATVLEVDDSRSPTHVVLDCGINVADDTLVERHELFVARSNRSANHDRPLKPHRLVGPICTPADVLYSNWWMAPVEAGDVVAIMDTGGPYVAESTTFSFPRPAVISVDERGASAVLRDAETFDDLVALDSFEPATSGDSYLSP